MKRFLGFIAVSLLVLVPFVAKAATTKISPSCSAVDSEGYRTCTIGATFETATDSVTVTLKEQGGADVTSIVNASNSEYTIGTPTEADGVHTIVVTHDDTTYGPVGTGEYTLFSFTYKVSGEKDCKVVIGLGDTTTSTPDTPTPDTPGENKQTGSSVPYIALGTMLVLAGGAYLLTKNKSKMYNI